MSRSPDVTVAIMFPSDLQRWVIAIHWGECPINQYFVTISVIVIRLCEFKTQSSPVSTVLSIYWCPKTIAVITQKYRIMKTNTVVLLSDKMLNNYCVEYVFHSTSFSCFLFFLIALYCTVWGAILFHHHRHFFFSLLLLFIYYQPFTRYLSHIWANYSGCWCIYCQYFTSSLHFVLSWEESNVWR